jgi:hypothetical protein
MKTKFKTFFHSAIRIIFFTFLFVSMADKLAAQTAGSTSPYCTLSNFNFLFFNSLVVSGPVTLGSGTNWWSNSDIEVVSDGVLIISERQYVNPKGENSDKK